jgi:hypothetical protein
MPAGKLTEITMPPAGSWNTARIVASASFEGVIYLGTEGQDILYLHPGGTTIGVTTTAPYPFACGVGGMAVFNNKLYVAGGNGGLINKTAGGAWSAPSASPNGSSLGTVSWRPLGIPTQVLLGLQTDANGGTSLTWCPITADPMTPGSWSAPVMIGADRRTAAGPIVTAPRHAYVYHRDGIYDLDELGTRAFNIAPWIGQSVDINNGRYGMEVGGALYYTHAQGLSYVPTTGDAQYRPEWAQPGWGLPYEGPFIGLAHAATLHTGWGLVGFLQPPILPGTYPLPPDAEPYQSYICAGRRDPGGAGSQLTYGQASHIWHGAEAVVPGAIGHMQTYTMDWVYGYPRLLICTNLNSAGTQPGAWWQSLPKIGSPLQELIWGGMFEPADLSSLFLPADPWGQPSAIKQLLQIDLIADRLQLGSDYLKVLASVDGAAYVEQGTAEAEVYTSLAPSPVLEGRYLTTRIDNFGSAVLRSIELRAALGLQLREARTYRLVLAWDNALKSARSRETADPDLRMLDLQYLLGRVIQLDDGSASGPYRVRVLQIGTGERRRLGGPERASANGTEGAWAIVVPVTVSFLDYPFRWDGPPTDVFDADRVWA